MVARASALGVRRQEVYVAWTEEEDDILRKYYPTMGSKVVDMLPGRTVGSLPDRVARLGIKYIRP